MASTYDVQLDYNGSSGTALSDEGFISGRSTENYTIALSDVDGSENETSVRIDLQRRGQLPREGYSRNGSSFERCVDVSVSQESPMFYRATVTYASPPRPQDQEEDENINPWDLRAKIVSIRSFKSDNPTDEDASGEPIRNAGTDEAIEGITRPITDTAFVIRKNFLNFNLYSIQQFSDTTNNAPFLVFPAGVVKVEDINANISQHNGYDYYAVDVTFIARKAFNVDPSEAWYHRRKCVGLYEVVNGSVVRALDDEKSPMTVPVYLNKTTGVRKAEGATPDFITTQILKESDFSEMGLI